MPDRPNVLWISFEDTSPRFGCYGDSVAHTPNVDRLASEGCVYTNAFATAGVCAPARSAVITGMYPTAIGTQHMRTSHTNSAVPELPTPYAPRVPHTVTCFTEHLRRHGYYCCNNGKTDYQFPAPVTAWDANAVADSLDAVHWRRRPDPTQPFFAVFNLFATHESGMWERDHTPPDTDPNAVEVPSYLPDTPRTRKAIARQYDNIAYNDRFVGELLEQLREDGLENDTMVMIWSDHGEGLPRAKRWPYDGGVRVPLIVRRPGWISAGSTSDRLVSTLDLAPTVLSVCGIDVPPAMHGRAFLGPVAGEAREYVFATRDRYDESYDMVRAVRSKRYKLIRNYRPELPRMQWIPYRNRHPATQEIYRLALHDELRGAPAQLLAHGRPAEELYDLAADPWETSNVIDHADLAGVRSRLRNELDRFIGRYDRFGERDEAESACEGNAESVDGTAGIAAAPHFVVINEETWGIPLADGGGTFLAPALLDLYSATQGGSIAWRVENRGETGWRLFSGPVRLTPGTYEIAAKVARIGMADSDEARATFHIRKPVG